MQPRLLRAGAAAPPKPHENTIRANAAPEFSGNKLPPIVLMLGYIGARAMPIIDTPASFSTGLGISSRNTMPALHSRKQKTRCLPGSRTLAPITRPGMPKNQYTDRPKAPIAEAPIRSKIVDQPVGKRCFTADGSHENQHKYQHCRFARQLEYSVKPPILSPLLTANSSTDLSRINTAASPVIRIHTKM